MGVVVSTGRTPRHYFEAARDNRVSGKRTVYAFEAQTELYSLNIMMHFFAIGRPPVATPTHVTTSTRKPSAVNVVHLNKRVYADGVSVIPNAKFPPAPTKSMYERTHGAHV